MNNQQQLGMQTCSLHIQDTLIAFVAEFVAVLFFFCARKGHAPFIYGHACHDLGTLCSLLPKFDSKNAEQITFMSRTYLKDHNLTARAFRNR